MPYLGKAIRFCQLARRSRTTSSDSPYSSTDREPRNKTTRRSYATSTRPLDVQAYPATLAAADELKSVPLGDEFRFGLQLILDGIERARQAAEARAEPVIIERSDA